MRYLIAYISCWTSCYFCNFCKNCDFLEVNLCRPSLWLFILLIKVVFFAIFRFLSPSFHNIADKILLTFTNFPTVWSSCRICYPCYIYIYIYYLFYTFNIQLSLNFFLLNCDKNLLSSFCFNLQSLLNLICCSCYVNCYFF